MERELTQMMASLETTDGCEDRQQPKIYAKNSMDRFGDDLCQLLLSYLSFEDRFRCECVSKQFRRTVFGSVVCIEINDRFMQQMLKTTLIETLATIAIKCPNIETIDCRGIETEKIREHIPEVLAIFRDNCLNLREIYCHLWQNRGQTMPTIGPLVTRIEVMDHNIDTQSLTHCHRLSHLSVRHLSQVFYTSGQLMAKNLNTFELFNYSYEDYHRLSAFVSRNQSLKCVGFYENRRPSEETLTGLSAQLSRLPQLRRLTLSIEIPVAHDLLADSLRTIGMNCKQLERLKLHLSHTDSHVFNRKTLDSLRFCHRLKRLELRIDATDDEIVLDPLRHCKRLTHLELDFFNMTANVLKDLHINCPRLQYLFIHDFHSIIDAECLSHISRLPALQTLVIDFYNNFNGLRNMAQQLTQMMASLETTDGCEDRQQAKIYAKNSMDRFGDDLCALLLSYLSFEDRVRCECVSKQFRRTVFGSVVRIDINDRLIEQMLKTTLIETLATIAIKCPNIETIDCRGMWSKKIREHIPEVLAIFRDNCHHLRHIYTNLWQNSGQTMPTIGPLVTRIDVTNDYIDTQSLTHCHRLSHLRVNTIDQVFDTSGQLLAQNLHKFELNCCSDNYYHRLSAFVAHNLSLKCLDISYHKSETRDSLMEICGQLSQLTQLRELNLVLEIIGGQNLLTDSLRTIGVNCKQLKRLSLHFYADSTQCKRQILDSLRYYRRLKRLRLTKFHMLLAHIHLSLDSLSDCKRLTHLEMNLMGMDAKVLIDCHKHCPRLQYLWIDGNQNIDTECLSHISRLPALQTLVFHFIGFNGLSDIDFNDLLSRSPKLKTIEINGNNICKFYVNSK
ncbi:unnamed protein product [Medioppia subpectinata]|uniref:F-box domain-containing protein n=1 Tax=Medioppia subpectinata TaxID=1979941 RepID=A0A7R9KXM7_9ACAR|nr:unnamed protein product [Medioppia subpectinata]CAG2110628.1 unnamed protein product [Medioppia subpectinata]